MEEVQTQRPGSAPPHPISRLQKRKSSDWTLRSELLQCAVKVEKIPTPPPAVDADLPLLGADAPSLSGVLPAESGSHGAIRRSVRQPKSTLGKGKYADCEFQLKKPFIVVRPAPVAPPNGVKLESDVDHLLTRALWMRIFKYLPTCDLISCLLVCKTWNNWCCHRQLWQRISLRDVQLNNTHLVGIVRRQPSSLELSWTNLSYKQLSWLIARLPQLKKLYLNGCSWTSVAALSSCTCPLLRTLSLQWVECMTDEAVHKLLSSPKDSRPGFVDTKTKLRCLTELRLTGCDISDKSVKLITERLGLLQKLDISYCARLTNEAVEILCSSSDSRNSLTELNVSSCNRLTNQVLDSLKKCPNIELIDLRDCPLVSRSACLKFVSQSRKALKVSDQKLIEAS